MTLKGSLFAQTPLADNSQVNSSIATKNFPLGPNIYPISLDEVCQLVLKNNLDIQIARYDAQIAKTKKGVAESIYDTLLNAQVSYQNDQSAKSTTILGTKTADNTYNISAQKKTPTGTTLTVSMENNREWTNSPFVTAPLVHDSSLGVSVTQELGRNFLGIQDRGNVRVTLLDIQNAQYISLDKIEQMLSNVHKAYWDLVFAIEKRKIEEDMLERAKELLASYGRKFKVGLVESPDLFATEANYEMRKNELAVAENDVKTKMNALKLLLNIEDDNVILWPTEELQPHQDSPRLEDSLKAAFNNRRDYKEAINDAKAKDITLAMKKRNLWPEINLKASWTQNGLGDHFPQAVENITDENNPALFAGLEITFPLENTKARSEYSEAKLAKAKTLIALKLLERKISINVVDKLRTCKVLGDVMENNENVVSLQQKKLEAEKKRFSHGRSNTDTIIRFQQDLLDARLLAAQSKKQYYDCLVDLKVVEGTLLSEYWKKDMLQEISFPEEPKVITGQKRKPKQHKTKRNFKP